MQKTGVEVATKKVTTLLFRASQTQWWRTAPVSQSPLSFPNVADLAD